MGKRELILAEAIRLFNRQGYFDTRLEDIADNFGVGKTSVSYHFKNKQLMLVESYSRACDFQEELITASEQASTGLDRILEFVLGNYHRFADILSQDAFPIALMSDFSGLDEPDASDIGDRYKALVSRVHTMCVEGIGDKSIEVDSSEAATFLIFNIVHWLPKWLELVPERRQDEAAKGLCDLLKNGLRGPAEVEGQTAKRRRVFAVQPAIFDRDARNAMKMEAILRTGIRHLNRNGYRNLSLDDISAELGVTRGALYYQIPDKESFLSASFDRTFDLIEKALELHASDPDQTAFWALERVVTTLFDAHITELDPLLRINLIPLLDGGAKRVVEARLKRILAQLSELIGRGQIDGSIRSVDCESFEYLILGAMIAASSKRFAATRLDKDWHPGVEPVFSATNYFEPIFNGLSARK